MSGDNRLLSPVVRRLVNEHGLDPDSIPGTGPGGRITRDDVLDHIDATGANARRPLPLPLLPRPLRLLPRHLRPRHLRPHPRRRPLLLRRRRPASATRRCRCRRSARSPATTW